MIDSNSFETLFKFRDGPKNSKEKCSILSQSEYQKSLLISIHANKLNINKLKIINKSNKSSIYCEQIQSIIFGKAYILIYDIKETKVEKLIIGLEKCLFIWERTYKTQDINMSNSNKRKLLDRVLSEGNFPEERDGYAVNNIGECHFIPYKAFNFNNFKNEKIIFIEKIYIKKIIKIDNILYVTLIIINNNISALRFYNIDENELNFEEKNDIIIKNSKYNNLNMSNIFNINAKYFGLINIEYIYIISAKYKEIVSIYLINDSNMIQNMNSKNKVNCFIPSCFLLFHDYYFLIQFIDVKTNNIYLKMFKIFISSKNNFVEIFNYSKKQIKAEDLIFNMFSFKDIKDTNEKDMYFCAKFFITNNKNNMIKKWIITDYEKD